MSDAFSVAGTLVRILYHHRTLGDGAEGIHIHEMVAAFRALGHEVEVLSLARPETAGRGDRGPVASMRRVLPAGLDEVARLLANLLEYVTVRRALARWRPHAVYKRHALFDIAVAAAAARARVPVILEVNALHSLPVLQQFEPVRLRRVAAWLERAALRSARIVVAVSTPLAAHVRALAGPAVTPLVLPNGVDPARFDPARVDRRAAREQLGLDARFVVGWTGILRAWHGLDLLLRAVRGVPDATLLVVGDGPERPALEHTARALGMSDRLRITGRVPHDAMPHYIAAFDVAVAADDRTGFASPMKVVEYMALARAVVVPRLPNFGDLVDDGRTGLQFRPGDADDLAEMLRRVSASPDLRRQLGAAARAEVAQRLNWQHNARLVASAVAASTEAHR